MVRIFRSIIDIKKDNRSTIEQKDLKQNYRAFLSSNLEPEDPSHVKIYEWIESHYRNYESLPAIELLMERAQKDGDGATLSSLEEIAKEIPYTEANFLAIVREKFDEQSKNKFQNLLSQTWQVVNSGLKIGRKKTIKGISAAMEYFTSEARKLIMNNSSMKTESDIRTDEVGEEVIDSYLEKKNDPGRILGMYSFMQKIDDSARGVKPGELMLIAGFMAQGKTTVSANLAYNGIIQGYNGMFVAMEMGYEEMTDMFYTLHTSNYEWLKNPKFKNMVCQISYNDVCYGELSEQEEEFFIAASRDFYENPEYGHLWVYQPEQKLTPSLLEMKMYEYNARLREEYNQQLDFCVVDYVGLMVPDKNERYGDFNTDLNNTIKRLKTTAMTFDNGRKVRMISPFQVNRDGWRDAQKNDGVFKLTALSNANEAERTSDLIITVYFSREMKRNGIVKIGCLKMRKGAGFDPFEARLDLSTRHLRDLIEKPPTGDDDDNLISEIPLEL